MREWVGGSTSSAMPAPSISTRAMSRPTSRSRRATGTRRSRRQRRSGVDETSTVVDLGAGTGAFARPIAPHVARVVAVDVSEPMVAAIRAHGIEAVHAGFLTYQHEGAPPDAVYG